MKLPLQDSANSPPDTNDKLNELRRLRKENADGLRELLVGVKEYQIHQDERLKTHMDYLQSWTGKQKGIHNG
jgi:hypothetical protein